MSQIANNFDEVPEFDFNDQQVQSSCKDIVCQNNGACLDHIIENSICLCNPPFYGNVCQFKDYCYENPCHSDQICRQHLNESFTCETKPKKNQYSPFSIRRFLIFKFKKLSLNLLFFCFGCWAFFYFILWCLVLFI